MGLAGEIERRLAAERSVFLAQLLREDLARARTLLELAAREADRERFLARGRALGWTPGDQRTAELLPVLDPFLAAVFEGADDERVVGAWLALTRARIDRLVGCLSTRPPPPEE